VSKAPDATFRTELPRWIDVRDYMLWLIHATAITAGDSYGKNAVHVHDPASGAPWRVVVWDYNDSFGQNYDSTRIGPTEDPRTQILMTPMTYYENNNLWRRMWLDSTYGPMIRTKYAAMLKNELRREAVEEAFERFVKETDASARRDERRWGAAYRTFYGPAGSYPKRADLTTHAQEVAYVRSWIASRWAYLATLFP
jgi:hypothetical protein